MDLTIDIEDYKLNIRAAGIITHNNKILLHKDQRDPYYALVGGRVEIGESSEETIKREIVEELGKEIEIIGYISTIENFFKAKNKKFHEITFVYQAEFKNEEDKKILDTMKNIEGKDYLQYEWIDIDKMDNYDIRPAIIKSIIIERKFPVHKINIDS